MHELQKFILVQLITNQSVSFSKLKPVRMESSKLSYHLQKLIERGLVVKLPEGYQLSPEGKSLAESFELSSLSVLSQPRIVVLAALHDPKNGWLLSKRLTHPSLHMVGFPKLNIPLGSNLEQTASRALHDLCGLRSQLRYCGHGYITQYRGKEQLESQVLFHLLSARGANGQLRNSSDTAELYWDKNPDWQSRNMIPSMPHLIQRLRSNKFFFLEKTYYL